MLEDDDILRDARGNTASIKYFGSRKAAQNALDSLIDCDECVNCSDCSRCSRCSRCSDCSDCSRCSRCSDCSGCSGCSDCSDCQNVRDRTTTEGAEGPPSVPVISDIHAKVYAAASKPNALDMHRWHCGTTHCRAGWVVTLAGEPGKALESFYNTELAAMMIYDASDPAYRINPGRFYDTSERALADMKALAKKPAPPAAPAEEGRHG